MTVFTQYRDILKAVKNVANGPFVHTKRAHCNPSFMQEICFENESHYNLRNNNEFFQPRVRSVGNSTESVRFKGPQLWQILPQTIGEGEVAFFSAKRWNCRIRIDLIESVTPCRDAQVVGPYWGSNPLHLTVLAAMSEDYTTAPQHLQYETLDPLLSLKQI